MQQLLAGDAGTVIAGCHPVLDVEPAAAEIPPYYSGLSVPAAVLRRGVWLCSAGRRGRFA
jgi:hypothetical protein